jgi:hypothetical protein
MSGSKRSRYCGARSCWESTLDDVFGGSVVLSGALDVGVGGVSVAVVALAE